MWERILDSLLATPWPPFRPGIAEFLLWGILCCIAGAICGGCIVAICLSGRLRRFTSALVIEILTGFDRPAVVVEDRLAGYRRGH